MPSNEKKRQPWHIVEFILILAALQVVKGQNPHDAMMLLQILMQVHH